MPDAGRPEGLHEGSAAQASCIAPSSGRLAAGGHAWDASVRFWNVGAAVIRERAGSVSLRRRDHQDRHSGIAAVEVAPRPAFFRAVPEAVVSAVDTYVHWA